MEPNLRQKKLAHWFLILFLGTLFVNFNLVSTESQSSLNVYHVLTPVAILLFCLPLVLRRSQALYLVYFLVLISTSLATVLAFGLNIRIVLLGFCCAAFLIGYQIPLRVDSEKLGNIFVQVSWFVLVLVIVKSLYFLPVLLHSFSASRSFIRTNIWSISSGGPNLEVTVLAMLALMTMGRRVSLGLMGATAVLSAIYQSRAGIIALFICLLAYYFAGGFRSRTIKLILGSFAAIIVLAVSVSGVLGKLNVLERFTNIQEEFAYGDEGLGRVALYQEAAQTLSIYPFGVGTGNGMQIMEKITGVEHRENNPHNIYISIALEGGIQSLVLLLAIAARIAYLAFYFRFRNRFANAAFVYVLLGMVQFLGYDMPGWVFIGMLEGSLVRDQIERRRARAGSSSMAEAVS